MADYDQEYGLLDRAATLLVKCKRPGLLKNRASLAAEASACVALAAELRERRLDILEVEREAALAVVEADKVKEAIRLGQRTGTEGRLGHSTPPTSGRGALLPRAPVIPPKK